MDGNERKCSAHDQRSCSRTMSSLTAADGLICSTCSALLCAFVKHAADRSSSFDGVQPEQQHRQGQQTSADRMAVPFVD